jgi:hypothetical protein
MKRGQLIGLSVLLVVLGAAGIMWAFGTPQAPVALAPQPAEASAAEAVQESPMAGVAAGMPAMGDGDPSAIGKEAPPPDPDSPLAIQIPGCTCHSDDEKIVEEHASYRMNQCFGCHSGR